jgi:hypothetical protein
MMASTIVVMWSIFADRVLELNLPNFKSQRFQPRLGPLACDNWEADVPSAHETAYPRLKSNPSPNELATVYTPTREETALADRVARGEIAHLGFLILLKTFQRLGYFIQLRDVPPVIIEHVVHTQGFLVAPGGLDDYDESGTRRRHVAVIRAHQRVKPFGAAGLVVLGKAVRDAAQAKEDLADIMNVAIEELIRQAFELPGFTTIHEEAQRGRAEINRGFYAQVFDSLGEDGRTIGRIRRVSPPATACDKDLSPDERAARGEVDLGHDR